MQKAYQNFGTRVKFGALPHLKYVVEVNKQIIYIYRYP